MQPCDLTKLGAYLEDRLSIEDAGAVESHLAECESCRDELMSRTSGAGFAVRSAAPWDRVPDRVNLRVWSLSRPRVVRWVCAATAAAASLAVFLALRGSTASNRQTAAILLTSRTPLARPGGTIRTRGIARVRLVETPTSLIVVPLLGSVEVACSNPGALSVKAGSWTAPIKGRCLVDVSPSGDVRLTSLGDSVTMTAQNQTRTIPSGFSSSVAVWDLKPAADDPFALASQEAAGTPSFLSQLAQRMKVTVPTPSYAEELAPDEVAALERADTTESLADVVRAAEVLAMGEHTEAAAGMVGWALQLSPTLNGVSIEQRRALAVGLARDRGDLGLASRCADVRELGDWKRFIDAWRAMPEFPTVAQREAVLKASQAIVATTPAEKLSLAEGVGLAGRARAGARSSVRWEPGLRESEKLGYEVARNPAATAHQQAMGYHAVSESVNYLPGGKIEGLNALYQAIGVWRRPHWLVHYAARAVELKSYERNQLAAMAIEGLAGDPSWPSFDRATVMMHDICKSPVEKFIARDFTLWVADLFVSVPDAQDKCGTRLEGWYQAQEAKRIQARLQALLRENPNPTASPTQ